MEASQAHNKGGRRVFNALRVLDACADNGEVFPRYHRLRATTPQDERVFFHSGRETLDVEVQYWQGIRPAE